MLKPTYKTEFHLPPLRGEEVDEPSISYIEGTEQANIAMIKFMFSKEMSEWVPSRKTVNKFWQKQLSCH